MKVSRGRPPRRCIPSDRRPYRPAMRRPDKRGDGEERQSFERSCSGRCARLGRGLRQLPEPWLFRLNCNTRIVISGDLLFAPVTLQLLQLAPDGAVFRFDFEGLLERGDGGFVVQSAGVSEGDLSIAADGLRIRSEERRVGKECRSRWLAY